MTKPTFREISEMLRNPDGSYFAEGSPALIALETMVDTVGLRNVIYALATIADGKSEHVQHAWQDGPLAKYWERQGTRLDRLAEHTPNDPGFDK